MIDLLFRYMVGGWYTGLVFGIIFGAFLGSKYSDAGNSIQAYLEGGFWGLITGFYFGPILGSIVGILRIFH